MQLVHKLRVQLDGVKRICDLADQLKYETNHLFVPEAHYIFDVIQFERVTRLDQHHAYSLTDELPDFAELNDLIETVELHVLWTGLKCFLQVHLILRLELAVGALLVHLTISALS